MFWRYLGRQSGASMKKVTSTQRQVFGNMNTFNKISICLIVISFFLFLSAYYYHQQSSKHNLRYSNAVAEITSQLSNKVGPPEAQLTSKGYVLTEERGILVLMVFSVTLCVIAIGISFVGYKRLGSDHFLLPLNFSALVIMVWEASALFQIGLHTYV